MVLLDEKVGGNIDMTGDGHIGGDKMICKKGYILKEKKQKKRNFSQFLGLQTYLVNLFSVL